MENFLIIFQIILAVSLAGLIFLQSDDSQNSRSNLLSTVNFQKRGWEKVMFISTFVVLALFLISSIIQIVL